MGGQRPRETRGGGGRGCTGRHGGRALRWEGAPSVQWGLGRGAPAGRRLRLGGYQAGMVGRVKESLRSPSARPAALLLEPGAQGRGFSASWGLVASRERTHWTPSPSVPALQDSS